MSRNSYPSRVHDHRGNEIRLPSKPFAVGGEGAVFEVVGMPNVVAKLYSKRQNLERCEKLRAMTNACSPELLRIAAWPKATLHNGNPADVEGILMPRIVDHVEIHQVYNVAERKRVLPEADWGYLLHVARNCAIAFDSIHRHGHVVGDVNEKNVMVSRKGIVALVDSDSFQIKAGSRVFRCGVGVDNFTPPELQGKDFAKIDRVPNHDNFGLAILVFSLLMMGRHPFAGVPQIKADITIPQAILEGIYAYARNPTKLKPPPQAPPIAMLDGQILDCFERAFGSAQRPTASEWRSTIDTAMNRLTRCKDDPRRSYLKPYGQCPWCQLFTVAQITFFVPGMGTSAQACCFENFDQLFRKLTGMQLILGTYTRPKPRLPIAPTLPPHLRNVQKPSLQEYPTPPATVDRPSLVRMPDPPVLLPRPATAPHPPFPQLDPKPRGSSYPPEIPLPKPQLEPHPAAPIEPPPQLVSLPPRPGYPKAPAPDLTPPDPDPVLLLLCIGGLFAGFPLMMFGTLVGLLVIIAFATCLAILFVLANHSHEVAVNALRAAHHAECEMIDRAYAEQCSYPDSVNQRRLAEWERKRVALAESHQKACEAIDKENFERFAEWEAANAASKRRYDRACRKIDEEYRNILDKWEGWNAIIRNEHAAICKEIDERNRLILEGWKKENSSRQTAYDNAVRDASEENRRRIAPWEALTAARMAEHDRACREVDEANRRLIAEWEVHNEAWLNESKRWRERVAAMDAEILRLEAKMQAERTSSLRRFDQRKKKAEQASQSVSRIRQDFSVEIARAERDSNRIQLEERLEKSLIRTARLKGMTSDRILSLESFGIATAKDVPLLKNQKVPGIGPVLSNRLFDWQSKLASSFKPQKRLPESERNRITNHFAPAILPLRQSIQVAIHDLEEIARSQHSSDFETERMIAEAVHQRTIAQAHVVMLNLG